MLSFGFHVNAKLFVKPLSRFSSRSFSSRLNSTKCSLLKHTTTSSSSSLERSHAHRSSFARCSSSETNSAPQSPVNQPAQPTQSIHSQQPIESLSTAPQIQIPRKVVVPPSSFLNRLLAAQQSSMSSSDSPPKGHFSLKARGYRFVIEISSIVFGAGITMLTLLISRPLISGLHISGLTLQFLIVSVGVGAYYALSSRLPPLKMGYNFSAGKFGSLNPFYVLLAGLVAGGTLQMILSLFADQDEEPLLRQLGISGDYAPHMILGGPFVEEVVFRWMLFGRLFQSVGVVPAYLLSVPLFGIAHYSADSAKVLASGVAGLIFTFTYHATGKLWVPIVLHSFSNAIACAYFYLLNPFVEDRQTRLYMHFLAMFSTERLFHSMRIALASMGWKHERIGLNSGPTMELHELSNRLFSRLAEGSDAMHKKSFTKLVHFLPEVQNELADALVVLLQKSKLESSQVREESAKQCLAYVNDANSAIWRAIFGDKESISSSEFESFLMRMCLEEKNFLALKEIDKLPDPISFTYSVSAPTKSILNL